MQSTFGLDIGFQNIRLVELLEDKNKIDLVAAGSIPMPPKAMSSNVPSDQEAVSIAIKKLVKDSGTKSRNVCIALPESQVFTRVIQVPQLSKQELASAIRWEAEQYIPMPLDQVNLDYSILRDSKETGSVNMEIILVAAPKTLVDRYVHIIEMSDLVVQIIETDCIATLRALSRSMKSVQTAMIMSITNQATNIIVTHNNVLQFSRSINAGSEALIRAVSETFNVSQAQAQEYLSTYGFEKDKLGGRILQASSTIMNMITKEVKNAESFLKEKYKDVMFQTIFISGDIARLPGFVVYLAEVIGVESQLANPWIGITKDSKFLALEEEGPQYTTAIGLALR